MRLSIQKAIATGFGAALAIVSLIGVISYRRVMGFVQDRVAVEHTYVVLQTLERAASELADAESRARGYIITGDSVFLRPYREGESAAVGQLAALRQLTLDNPTEQRRLATLEQFIAGKFRMLGIALRLRDEQGFAAAQRLVAAQQSAVAMPSVRHLINEMELDEAALLRERSAKELSSVRRLTVIIALGIFVAFVISILADAVIRREMTERARSEEAVLRAKEAAEAASQAKSFFLARMSHELRTPLNAVIGFANVLLKNKSGQLQPQELSYLSRILANGKELLALINDVLDLTKIEAGKIDVSIVSVSLGALVLDVVAQFEQEVRERPLALRTELPAAMLPLDTDPGKLAQVLKNLVANALKFTKRGRVTVKVHVESGTGRPLCIDVIDTGVGIPPHRQRAIFQAFEQADSSTARQYGGTGLGLAISQSLCRCMGYELEVASEPERGSIFSVLLAPEERAPARRHDTVAVS